MASEIRSHFLEGPAGKLEALLNVGEENASHAAIVCREYGLPAVVGTGRATAEIKTGQRIQVDGSTGVVTILDS